MLMYFLVALVAVAFVVLALSRPIWALFLIVFLLPTYLIRFNIGFVPFTFLETMILLLALALFLTKKIDWKKIRHDSLFWPIIAILIAATIAVFASYAPVKGAGIWKAYFVEPIIFYWLMLSLIDHRRYLEGLFWALGGSVIYLSLIALWQKIFAVGVPLAFLDDWGGVDRVVSVFGYPNAIGLFFGPIIVLFLGFLTYRNSDSLLLYLSNANRFWFKLAVVVLGSIVLVLAKSEGAILAVLICGWLIFLCNKKTRLIAVVMVVLAILIILINPNLREFAHTKLFLLDWSGQIRRLIWGETWQMLQNNWFFGAGLSGYSTAIIPYHAKWFEIFPYPHNVFLNLWSELGIPGLIAFAWLAVAFFWMNVKNIFTIVFCNLNEMPFDKIASFVFLLVGLEMVIHGLVDAPYFKNDLSMLFWVMIGAASLNAKVKSNKIA
jgi:O-antigen ligase